MDYKFFTGRISRGGYFASIYGTLFFMSLINILYGLVPPYKIFMILEYTILNPMVQLSLWAILFIILSIKRLHDMNYSGMWFLVPLGFIVLVTFSAGVLGGFVVFPSAGFAVLLMSLKKGTVGSNRFGEDPVYRKIPATPLGK